MGVLIYNTLVAALDTGKATTYGKKTNRVIFMRTSGELMVDLIETPIRGQDQSDFREAILKDLMMVLVFE